MFGRPIVSKLKNEVAKIPKNLLRNEAFIGGKWKSLENEFDITHPVNGELICSVANCTVNETHEAIRVAQEMFPEWSNKTAKERAQIIRKWGLLMDENQVELAKLISAENGKPLAEAMGEVTYASSFCEWSAEECRRTIGETIPSPWPNARIMTIKQPIGVVGMITPWNFPAAMITRKAAPALAVGCPVVLKPSEDTPLTALALAELASQAGLPDGLFSVLPSDRDSSASIGKLLCEDESIKAISFTGSTHVGSILLSNSASTVKKVSLELGGLGPFIVFESADLNAAADGLMVAKFRNSGQTCVCANNVLVQESVHDEFVEILKTKIEALRFGDVFDAQTTISCLINNRGLDKVESQVANAISKGAICHTGGNKIDDFHFEPTLLTNVPDDADCFNSETFGPLCAIKSFAEEDDAIKFANLADVGLAGYFYSQNNAQCFRVAEKLEVGMVGVNTGLLSCCEGPFGGVKKSGLGREGSTIGTEEFLETKYMCFGGIN